MASVRFSVTLLFWLVSLPALALQLDKVAAPLTGIPVPSVAGLHDGPDPIVVNQTAAVVLGKALFWDMAVGSDGMACASCHFHAGADRRTRNQLEPGSRHDAPTGRTFQTTATGAAGGPGYRLKSGDFPFFRFSDPADKRSSLTFSTDDVVSSSGVYSSLFRVIDAEPGTAEHCESVRDDIFHVGADQVRRVTTRNAPTVFNAVFNYRSFWDGRANNLFNGETVYGPRDENAGVWEMRDGKVTKTRLALPNASLASQAVAPPLDSKEMACGGRRFADLGRKLMNRRPLATQTVHARDSVLADIRHASGRGLDTTYGDLIRQVFSPRFWNFAGEFGGPGNGQASWTQAEANFALFFGLAIQLYESTLISDQTPFDAPRGPDGFPAGFTKQQKRGHILFDKAECDFCHHGPTLSLASHPATYGQPESGRPLKLIDRRVLNIDRASHRVFLPLVDVGFANTGVTPSDHDPGIGGRDPRGQPLSFAEQYRKVLLDPAQSMVDPIGVSSAHFSASFGFNYKDAELTAPGKGLDPGEEGRTEARVPRIEVAQAELQKPYEGRLAIATRGAFKVPTLRNIELTGPYMHNGGMKSLREVIEFYDRGGNVENPEHFGTFVFQQHFTPAEKADLLAFLLTLTDERVRWERAPFDHPSLEVPHGGTAPSDSWPPVDRKTLSVPAVGRDGRTSRQGPLKPFDRYLD
jgi:cytochrome c peroxidase